LVENIERITSKSYQMTFEDILHASRSTLGIVSNQISKNLKILDTGGHRSERKKWKITFQDANAILFFVNLSSFALKCFEDEKSNKADEDYNTYSEMVNEQWFKSKPIFLIFNMADLFASYLSKFKLNESAECYKDFDGKNEYRECLDFIKQKYLDLRSENVNIFVTSGFDFERNLILTNKMVEKLNGNKIDSYFDYEPIQ
jgi:GTPase SAR1 family protein